MPDGVVQLPSGRWRWRVQIAGRRVTGTADSLTEAVRDRAQASIDAGGAPPRNVTVRELVGIWLTDVDHAETTATRRDEAIDAVPAEFMDREAALVTPVVVRSLWQQMASAGTGAHTILKASHALSSSYRHGITLELVPTNPITAVRPKVPPAKRITVPTRDTVRRLLGATARRPDLYAWVRFAAVTGARPGEVCGLQWTDLDEQRRVVRVSRSINRRRNETPGKNRERGHRDVPVDPQTFAALKRVERIVGCPWIFTHDGRHPWRPGGATLEIRRALDRVGAKMRPYDLRHFAATEALQAGRPVHEVAAMLGDNPATVLRVYAHAIPNQSRSAVAVAAALDA